MVGPLPVRRPRDVSHADWQRMKRDRKEELAREREDRGDKSKTCQICGRPILANRGVIAHHGYERPWAQGYQTSSCFGAKKLPFEVSREDLKEEIEHSKGTRIHMNEHLENIRSEVSDLSVEYQVLQKNPGLASGYWEEHYLHGVNRANFDAKKIECPEAFEQKKGPLNKKTYAHAPYTFDILKADKVSQMKRQIKGIEEYIDAQQKRYDEWKQTHTIEWIGGNKFGKWIRWTGKSV